MNKSHVPVSLRKPVLTSRNTRLCKRYVLRVYTYPRYNHGALSKRYVDAYGNIYRYYKGYWALIK